MPYDKTQVSGSDRRIFAEQDDEVSDLAQKYGLSQAQIRELISRVGNDREKLDQAFDLYLFNMGSVGFSR
jgi:Mor family transcriptional regulator